ncbi:MAG: DUF3800 domain-containing protein [Proteobacteria bacterium]|nr:DUF3800 domain-containing protein [Pseudomonadota bacterium]
MDETGDHGLSFIDKNFPLFLLCGCIIKNDALKEIEERINSFKQKCFQTTEVILHSREIRKCEGAFQILFDLQVKGKFYRDLNQILEAGQYCLIGAGIQKEEHIKRYGKGAKDPYALSLSFILERLIFYLDKIDKTAKVEIFVEERGKKEDQMLLAHFNSILDRGTFFVQSDRFKSKIRRFSFHSKKDNIIGLQLADLCAYPLARHLLNPKEPYIPFKIIEDKIYCIKKGSYKGWGLKLFP